MTAARLRTGELLAGAGAVGLLVVLFLDWFEAGAGGPTVAASGWSSVGWLLDLLLALSILGAIAVVVTNMRRSSPALPVGASVLTWPLGGVTFLILLTRVLLFQPALDLGLRNAQVDARLPAYLGLLFAALIPVGAFMVIKDERLDAPESAYTPPPARAVPGT